MSARYRTLFTTIALSLVACADDSRIIEDQDDNVEVEQPADDEPAPMQPLDAAVNAADAQAGAVDAATQPDAAVALPDASLDLDASAALDAAQSEPDAAEPPHSNLPCEVEAILVANCQRCHGPTAKNGVPLMTRDDLLAPSPKDPTANVITRVLLRVAAVEKPMPPVGKGEALADEDRAVLESWVLRLMPAERCEPGAAP